MSEPREGDEFFNEDDKRIGELEQAIVALSARIAEVERKLQFLTPAKRGRRSTEGGDR
jgi:hypothetical protein